MESGKQKRKRKMEKLTCLVCKRSFGDDYRHEHNKKYHDNLLKAGKSIAYKVAGAPANPFILAAQIHSQKLRLGKSLILTCNASIPAEISNICQKRLIFANKITT